MNVTNGPGADAPSLVLDIRRLGRAPGESTTVRRTVPAPCRMGATMIAIETGAPIELDLLVQSVSEGVLVTGAVDAPVAGQCTRCLDQLDGRVHVDLTELYAYPGSATDVTTDDEDVPVIDDDAIDLEQSIIDAVGVALPLNPTCETIALTPCTGTDTPPPDAVEGEEDVLPDPRWAGLRDRLGGTDGEA